jgi:hypothetical protein
MSRSYKHTPIYKGGSRISKQQANKRVRQRLKDIDYEIGNFTHYKSIVESWDIFDYKCYCPTDKTIYRK